MWLVVFLEFVQDAILIHEPTKKEEKKDVQCSAHETKEKKNERK